MRPENRSELGLGSNMGLADSPFSKSALLQHCLLHSNVRDGDRGEGRQDSNLLTGLPGEWENGRVRNRAIAMLGAILKKESRQAPRRYKMTEVQDPAELGGGGT